MALRSYNKFRDDMQEPKQPKPKRISEAEGHDIVYQNKSMRNVISSTQSLTAKKIHGLLLHRKKREKHNQVVVEGPRLIFDLYRNQETRKFLQKVLINIDVFDKYAKIFHRLYEQNPDKPTNDAYPHRIAFHPTYKEIFKACCSDTVEHQGIVAICEMPHPVLSRLHAPYTTDHTDDEPLSSVVPSEHRMYLVCDAIQDPGNIGTLVRSAVACGVTAIYLLPNACDVWNPKAIRAAMGATFAVPIISTESWEDCYRQLQIVGCTPSSIYAATMMDDVSDEEKEINFEDWDNLILPEKEDEPTVIPSSSKAYFDVDWIGRGSSGSASAVAASALVIGAEGNGLTVPLRNSIQNQELQTVYVPMMNQDRSAPTSVVESLNAAVCGSIILFEYLRQKQLPPSKALE